MPNWLCKTDSNQRCISEQIEVHHTTIDSYHEFEGKKLHTLGLKSGDTIFYTDGDMPINLHLTVTFSYKDEITAK
jgi:hypothetical protein